MSEVFIPGPWNASGKEIHKQINNTVFIVATAHEWGNSTEATALLIAAAPDLLEACIQARSFLETIAANASDLDALDAAIAKATGGAE